MEQEDETQAIVKWLQAVGKPLSTKKEDKEDREPDDE
jgi:hypothetical protein